ncbi:protein ACCELERATED CELL DEATH 6-like [Durio zibethinus]|uniref:Protein ACCELERATED CELL DEATH 6-like n=1 Tax=Durio zibethinus TaxID=66656 RepID=A0A6P5WGB9_DURZI|nr:protein ACCELERATED CELL DEATH 6-like [Durio zibethinus]
MHRNKDNHTAKDLFDQQHKDQLTKAQKWVKETSQSSSTVAVLVATVVFAAAYTAPGGFHAQSGRPVLLTTEKPQYLFFTIMDIAGLASSLTSLVVFLSVLTSSLELQEFSNRIPRNISIGFTSLFFSVTATMFTFTATIFLLVRLEKTWTATLTYAAAFLPISIFALFQFPLYYEFFEAAVKSILDFIKTMLPTCRTGFMPNNIN